MALTYSLMDRSEALRRGEKNDCVVRAIQATCSVSYDEAHRIARVQMHRAPRRGTLNRHIHPALKTGFAGRTFAPVVKATARIDLHGVVRRGWEGEITLARFVRENPNGTFFCLKAGHAFAIIDGVVHDGWKPGPRCRIRFAWEVKAPERAPAPPKKRQERKAPATTNRRYFRMGKAELLEDGSPGARAELRRRGRCPDTGRKLKRR